MKQRYTSPHIFLLTIVKKGKVSNLIAYPAQRFLTNTQVRSNLPERDPLKNMW